MPGDQRQPGREPKKAVHEQALREFANEFGMWKDMYRVSVYRVMDGRRLKFLGSYDAAETNLEFIRDLHGPGKYTVKLLDGGGRWVSQATICLDEGRISSRQGI
jgi:hypothetical protein